MDTIKYLIKNEWRKQHEAKRKKGDDGAKYINKDRI